MDETRGGCKARNVGLEMDLRIPPAPSLAQLNEQKGVGRWPPKEKLRKVLKENFPGNVSFQFYSILLIFTGGKSMAFITSQSR